MFVVDDEEKEAEKEGGNDVTQDDFPLEIVEVRDGDVDDGGETEEENTDAAADGVDQSEGPAMFLEAIFSLAAGILVLDMLRVTRVVTLYHHLHHLPLLIDSIIDTEVILKSSLRDEQ